MLEQEREPPRSGWVRKVLLYGLPICFGTLLVCYGVLAWQVEAAIRSMSEQAREEHAGQPIDALIAYAASEGHGLRKRNRAVWALGELRDKRGLSVLEELRTGQPCDMLPRFASARWRRPSRKSTTTFPTPTRGGKRARAGG